MKILVTAKVNPDLDGTACTLAYSDLLRQQGKDATGVVFGSPQSEVQYFVQKHGFQIPTQEDVKSDEWQEFVIVDASQLKGMPKSVVPEKVIEVIDHRKSEPEKDYPNAKIQNELIGAAATIVVERFIAAGKVPREDHAKLLYGGIYHNTLNFTSFNTSERDRKAVDFLKEKFHLSDEFVSEMFNFATQMIETDVAKALSDDAKEFGGGFAVGAYQLIVYGSGVLKQKEILEKAVHELKEKMGSEWSFLNVVDLEAKKSTIFVTNDFGREMLTKAIDAKFNGYWAEMPIVWLRKQIMPKVQEAINNKRDYAAVV